MQNINTANIIIYYYYQHSKQWKNS